MEDESEDLDSNEESDGNSEFDEDACSFSEQDWTAENPLTEVEVQDMINQLLEVESKAAEAQELLEEESLIALKDEVKAELSKQLSGSELDFAVEEEMSTYIEQWKETLDDLEDQSADLQERLDDAGIELPTLFKLIEKQAPQGCRTEAWRKRTHWAGLHASEEIADAVRKAANDLECLRPVKRRHGKFMEEGASGFLGRKLSYDSVNDPEKVSRHGEGWESLDALLVNEADAGNANGFGAEAWASVYLASTPQQAAHLGIPGADQVEEIVDLEKCEKDPFIAAALASERESGLTEQQKNNIRKVGEEDDIKKGRLMQRLIFKRRRTTRKSKMSSASVVACDQEQCAEAADREQNQGDSIAPSFLQNGVFSNLETSIQCHEDGLNRTRTVLCDRFLQDNTDDLCSKGQVSGDTVDEWKPDINDSGFEKSVQFESDTPKPPLKRCRNHEVAELPDREFDKVVINLDSDDDQGFEERNQPVCNQGKVTPAEPWDDVRDKKVSMDMPCSRNNDEEVAVAKDEKLEASTAVQSSHLVNIGERMHFVAGQDCKKFICTSCGRKFNCKEVCKHALLGVAICNWCRNFYQSVRFSKDANGSEEECSWCAKRGDVIMCDFCNKVFCQSCITLNFGDDELQRIFHATEWSCFFCNPEPLMPLIECCTKVIDHGINQPSDDVFSSGDEHSEFMNGGRRELRRKRLRRIIDDDELEESTRVKQALEKERKERLDRQTLDRLRESAKASTSSCMPSSYSLQECVINIARDADEEEILVPLGISKFLKPHQIEGVRFMWENCIESLKKIKSGDQGNGCIVAHNMGLGKTLQVIAFLYTVLKRKQLGLRTVLIVTPLNVLHNWPDEFEKWRPLEMREIPVYVLDELSRKKRGNLLSLWQETGGVMMIGYTAFRVLSVGKHVKDATAKKRICKALQNPGPDILVCDEAHMIKNRKADITQALKQVKTQRRIALTGSPLQNNLMEYYCMVDFVREGFLGRLQDFKNRFQNPIENGQHADSTEFDVKCMKERTHVLHKQLMGFVQRKGANVVEKELPPKFIYVISVRLSPLQRALYNRFIQLFWLSSEQGSSVARSRKSLFSTYHALAKVWNHPDLLMVTKEERDVPSEESMDDFICEDEEGISSDDAGYECRREEKKVGKQSCKRKELDGMQEIDSLDWCKDLIDDKRQGLLEYSGKLVLLMDILSMSSSRREKVLVFSQSIPTLNLIERFLEKLSRPGGKNGYWRRDKEWYRLDGQTKAKERQRLVKRFNDINNSKVQCVLISTKAGSLGINLQSANRVVILDGSWNPTHDIQALFRAWRFGQKKPVVVYRLLAYGTAEEKIYKRQVAKEGLAARVLDEQQVGRHSKMEELKVLFKLDEDVIDSPQHDAMELEQGCLKAQMEGSVRSVPLEIGNHLKASFFSSDISDHDAPEDEIMTSLLIDHRPKWIVRVHQHETLLVDREDEKLTHEEQVLAWENFRRIMENSSVEWVQVNSESAKCTASQVQNSWAMSFQAAQSGCSAKFHAELLSSKNTKNNEHVKCDICQQTIGWEHIVKGRPRGIH